MMILLNALGVLTTLLVSSIAQSSDLPTISAVGSKFFFENGTQYYVKGIAYQLTQDDPLISEDQCKLDAKEMADLGANTIRVYHVDPTANHDACMSAFAAVGIYLFVDLDTFDTQIDQDTPYWNQTQLSAFTAVFDAFHSYSNLAGVIVANEALTRLNGSLAAPFVKSAIRDVKAYRTQKGYRDIPVGYSGADIPELRPMLQNYLACTTGDVADSADFFSLNVYEWCGQSSFKTSGYVDLVKNATGLQIPIFISETGCHVPQPRLFDDQDSIFGTDMDGSWSGAIVYEWIQEANDYGLITYGPKVDPEEHPEALDGYPRSGTPTPKSPDYSNLKKHWATLHPTGVKLGDYEGSAKGLKPIACPVTTMGGWEVNPSAVLPSLGQTIDKAATSTGGVVQGSASASATKKGGVGRLSVEVGMGWYVVLGLLGVIFGMF
ncbi:uncharacterized protein KY384_007274 [Bacidia gigantensis]|uniref:uncharacterized protein n=1 Tax=Bacidia gigantensis TaxID=2732470 RepID=UPI001D040173|nr:uncharacterized protein KY384_007274 [Bacidia gigantensis]KAG8528356.1 hypothetical protein KY384_007274 [Bacidia gigantensis]